GQADTHPFNEPLLFRGRLGKREQLACVDQDPQAIRARPSRATRTARIPRRPETHPCRGVLALPLLTALTNSIPRRENVGGLLNLYARFHQLHILDVRL